MDWMYEPWPWYVAGPLIALIMFILLFLGKQFGMSSNLRTMCSIGGAGKVADFFRFDWKMERWNLTVVMGAVIGGFLVGFGARYAGGCTSGHAISGLSNLQLPSLIAVIGFFIGGLVMVHLLYPLLFG